MYTFEHVHNIFGSFWVIYLVEDGYEREVYYSRDFYEAKRVLDELRGE